MIAPRGGLFLTAGADVQKDRIEVSIWAWGRGLESWLIDHLVIEGDPGEAATWTQVSALLGETWPHASGMRLGLARLGIDSGYEAPAVYAWARRQGWGQVLPIKGVEGFNRSAPVSGPTHVDATEGGVKIKRGARLWTVAVATFKSETYRFLRLHKVIRTSASMPSTGRRRRSRGAGPGDRPATGSYRYIRRDAHRHRNGHD